MVKKAIDSRIPAVIRNGVQEKKRSFFVIVGDRQKDVIVNLYHILLNVDIKHNKSVLWAYKNKLLGFTSHRRKREQKIKKEIKRGIRDADTEDPFELFISTQNIRYVYYKETEKIMGNTYGMCILQDFEAITPNLLARTIETVEGGGLVLLLLKGMNSLKQLYTLSMDVHSRYRTEAHSDVTARFNERFILSLGSCESCLVVDDELNVLPISGGRTVQQLPPPTNDDDDEKSISRRELGRIKENLADSEPVGSLVKLARTVDQAKALLTFVDAITEKTLQSTVTLTAARGRGKSAALGVAIAAAIAHGYSNIFITSPSPENLKTLFEFVFKGFDALNYQDHIDYNIIQSTNPDFNKAVVRVNIHRQHRQTIQYIQPQDAYTLGQAELLVIDEAAAIPLPLVTKLMGPYLVFMASTINGYEGTGRSLSLKLISQLREQSRGRGKANGTGNNHVNDTSQMPTTRNLREITLTEPIRYSSSDAVEKWLNKLLCLDATLPQRSSLAPAGGTPLPNECQLLAVNRDTLFSFHPVSERFLHSMISLYVASHYKNSPNDLQLMSDAPAHHLYVLVPPIPEDNNRLPEPLCVIQVALEGQISKASVRQSLSRGQRAGGDLIPWLVSQQFQDDEFAGLSGARIVRIATNPDYMGMGYGRRALDLLIDFYAHKFLSLDENETLPAQQEMVRVTDQELESSALHTDDVKIRDYNSMPPLFSRLGEIRPPASLDYIGVSFGLTQPLHRFWKRAKFAPVYMRQTQNDLTGEHTCVMLRSIDPNADGTSLPDPTSWLGAFARDFHRRFLSLLSYSFRAFPAILSLSIDESATAAFIPRLAHTADTTIPTPPLTKADLDRKFTPHDLARLASYANNTLDHHVVLDLLPRITLLYFCGPLRSTVSLTGVQKALLLGVGAQRRDVEDVGKELGLAGVGQTLGVWVKVCRKIATCFRVLLEAEAAEGMPVAEEDVENDGKSGEDRFRPLEQTVDEDLEEGLGEVRRAEKERMKTLTHEMPLGRYEIGGSGQGGEWAEAERTIAKGADGGMPRTVSVKRVDEVRSGGEKRRAGNAVEEAWREEEEFRDASTRKKKKKSRDGASSR